MGTTRTRKEDRVDREHRGRIEELAQAYANGKELSVSDILSSRPVAREFEKPKLILSRFDRQQILASYPFTREIYVPICPRCVTPTEVSDFACFLDHRAIVPVLIGPYGEYADPVVKAVRTRPHISMHEFMFMRFVNLTASTDGGVCSHCIEMQRREYHELVRTNLDADPGLLDQLFHNLHPFIRPDHELLDEFGQALRSCDTAGMNEIQTLSTAVWDARTCQAMNARSMLPSRKTQQFVEQTRAILPSISDKEVEVVEAALAQNIQLEIPKGIDASAYLSCIAPYREELSEIADRLIDEATAKKGGQLTLLNSRLAELHEQLSLISRHKGYLTYRAAWGFTKTNKALLGSLILASAYGFAGNFLGCSVGLVGAAGAQAAKKFNRLRLPQDAASLIDEVKHSIRPYLHKLVAKYLKIDVRAVQLYEIKEVLNTPLGKAIPAKAIKKRRPRRA